MKRRTFLAMAVGVAALAGCGGGSSAENPAGRGAAQGFVFRAADGSLRLFASAAEGRAAGLAPASGARAQVVDGPSATVAGDGSLRLSGIEPGLRTLRLRAGGTTRDIALTVVPEATLPLGETPVSRSAAVEALRAFASAQGVPGLLIGADVLVSSTPLPAGVAFRPALPAGDETDGAIARPSWFVYVDSSPQARFGHPTLVAVVDAETGAVSAQDWLSWPVLNGASFYADHVINATSADLLQLGLRPAGGPGARSVVSRRVRAETLARAATCRSADPDSSRTHILMVQGDQRADFGADMEDVAVSLSVAPFPKTGTLRRIRTFEGSATPHDLILQEFATVRDACKSGDTFVLFITSHGLIPTKYDSSQGVRLRGHVPNPTPEEVATAYRLYCATGTGNPTTTYFDGSTYHDADLLDLNALDFSSCKACRIVLWIDTCFSGNWIHVLRPHLDALPDKDILLLTAANQVRQAEGLEWMVSVPLGDALFGIPPGGLFTDGLVEGLRRVREAGTAETGADALASAFAFATAVTEAKNTLSGEEFVKYNPYEPGAAVERSLQYPQLYRRPLDPEDVCGRGDQEVTIQ